MHNIDFSPLFRHSVGFDRMQKMLDTATHMDSSSQSYPPYNIEAFSENNYAISLAVAGFGPQDLDVTVTENTLIISGQAQDSKDNPQYLHRGIARRAFERRFQLADTIKVTGSSLDNGMLNIDLVREIPESQKPRKIEIASPAHSTQQIETSQAA
ncbi:MAG: Hsp20 family protein [Rhodospirillales bacterium]|nr:Hsp20 family protein [Rhodospirillales bacterium]